MGTWLYMTHRVPIGSTSCSINALIRSHGRTRNGIAEQTVARGAAGREVSTINVVRLGLVNGDVTAAVVSSTHTFSGVPQVRPLF